MAEHDVLVALTSGPRAYFGEPAFVPGSCADLIVVPAADVGSLATPRLVVRCGRVVIDSRV
jgi:hypothetical protein